VVLVELITLLAAAPELQEGSGTRWGAVLALVALFVALVLLVVGVFRVAGVRFRWTPLRVGGFVCAVALFALVVIPR